MYGANMKNDSNNFSCKPSILLSTSGFQNFPQTSFSYGWCERLYFMPEKME